MTLNLTIQRQSVADFSPRITVIGVGGGGMNAVDNMILSGLEGVEFLVANTDAQQLARSRADRRVQLGPHLTQGLGAGAKPEIGRAAAEEAAEDIARHLEGCHMVFITAGMGGGTGTGAAPVIARLARERGVLTVGVVTKPFDFERKRRMDVAEQGLSDLQQYVDTLIVIPNQNLFRMANERTGFAEAFKMADNVLYMGVSGVTDLMMKPGVVNLDFADIRTVMSEMGKAMMGTGEAEGEDRALRAAEAAISNPLLEDTSMRGARGVLVNITGGDDVKLFEVDEAVQRIGREVDPEANLIFGTSLDPNMDGKLRVSVVATGIEAQAQAQAERPRLVAMGGGGITFAASTQAVPGAAAAPGGMPGRPAQGPGATPAAPMSFRPAQPQVPAGAQPGPARMPAPQPAAPAMPGLRRAATVESAPEAYEQQHAAAAAWEAAPEPEMAPAPHPAVAQMPQRPVAAPAQPRPGAFSTLFRTATGLGSNLMRRQLPAEAEAAAPRRQEPLMGQPLMGQPSMAPAHPGLAPAPRTQASSDEMGLDIPTFLRRQNN
ncbi:cell division protein FtsZ [Humitalea rosea]|uniref:Cell division protein FtsZ n=1 Tax=Humitalea rosea TaxID=990373 RepID=A0A2W7HZ54_9PROT|nr:cell division protein FtsZ [Humitalea rosea]PZW37978.1 cell division protein FtsZ [Humitalea rosea]